MLLLLVSIAAAVCRYHTATAAEICKDIDTNAASCVHLHVRLQGVMLAEKRHLDRFVWAHFLSQPVKMPLLSQHDCL